MPAYPAFTVAWDTVVTREAAWFAAEPAYTGCPPLAKVAGGPFDLIQGYSRKVTPREKVLFVWRTGGDEQREAYGGRKDWRSHLTVSIFWPLSSSTGQLQVDLQNLDTAEAAVLARIRGPLGDNSHGGRFVACGETPENIKVRKTDPFVAMSSGEPLRTDITYVVLDDFVG